MMSVKEMLLTPNAISIEPKFQQVKISSKNLLKKDNYLNNGTADTSEKIKILNNEGQTENYSSNDNADQEITEGKILSMDGDALVGASQK